MNQSTETQMPYGHVYRKRYGTGRVGYSNRAAVVAKIRARRELHKALAQSRVVRKADADVLDILLAKIADAVRD